MKPEEVITQIAVHLGWTEVGIAVILISLIQILCALWIKARLEGSIKHSYDKKLEDYRYEIKIRDQASKVAEYMELARHLKMDSPVEAYERANRLSWELAMWLPSEIYKCMAEALVNPSETNNPLEVVVAVRQLLLRDNAGDLNSNNIMSHAPGAGAQHQKQRAEQNATTTL